MDAPSFSVSVSRRINIGDYESQDLYIGITKVPYDADDDFIKAMIARAEVSAAWVTDELENQAKTAILEAKKLAQWRRENQLRSHEIAGERF